MPRWNLEAHLGITVSRSRPVGALSSFPLLVMASPQNRPLLGWANIPRNIRMGRGTAIVYRSVRVPVRVKWVPQQAIHDSFLFPRSVGSPIESHPDEFDAKVCWLSIILRLGALGACGWSVWRFDLGSRKCFECAADDSGALLLLLLLCC